MTSSLTRTLCAGLALCMVTGGLAVARQRMGPAPKSAANTAQGTIFKCEGGQELRVQFSTDDNMFRAIVYSGDQTHTLPVRPWTDLQPPQVVWTDGPHTLTWKPNVEIMWMDGATHLSCGRNSNEHKH